MKFTFLNKNVILFNQKNKNTTRYLFLYTKLIKKLPQGIGPECKWRRRSKGTH
jgi:hypothetical protein